MLCIHQLRFLCCYAPASGSFLTGYLFASVSRTTTAYFYATERNLEAYGLIYGEPLWLLALLLVLPGLLGLMGTWISVPLSQLFTMAVSIFFIWKIRKKSMTSDF